MHVCSSKHFYLVRTLVYHLQGPAVYSPHPNFVTQGELRRLKTEYSRRPKINLKIWYDPRPIVTTLKFLYVSCLHITQNILKTCTQDANNSTNTGWPVGKFWISEIFESEQHLLLMLATYYLEQIIFIFAWEASQVVECFDSNLKEHVLGSDELFYKKHL